MTSVTRQIDQAQEALTMAGVTRIIDADGDLWTWVKGGVEGRLIWSRQNGSRTKYQAVSFANLLSLYGPLTPLVEGEVIDKPVVVTALYSKITTEGQLDDLPEDAQVTTSMGTVFEKKTKDLTGYSLNFVWRVYMGLVRVSASLLLDQDPVLTWLPKDGS